MKKLFTLLTIFILLSCVLFGQSFAKINYYQTGTIDTLTYHINWENKVKSEATLVSITNRRVTIHTDKLQQFFFQSEKFELEDYEGYYVKAKNSEGKDCVIYNYADSEKISILEIEYQNYIIRFFLSNLE